MWSARRFRLKVPKKLTWPDDVPVRTIDGVDVYGAALPVVQHADSNVYLTRWFVFADAQCRIGAEVLCPFDDVVARFKSGELSTRVPVNTPVYVDGLGSMVCGRVDGWVSVRDRIAEARDCLETLRGGAGSVAVCRAVYAAYVENPTGSARATLRAAYFAVPRHLRMYCGDMDTKDLDILDAINPQ
jgi:hypothetical protein